MNKAAVLARIGDAGVIPVVRAATAARARQVVEALRAGGLTVFEITLTVPGAVQLIESLSRELGDGAIVGAGTVLYAESARGCIAAGARFIVSPTLNRETIAECRKQEVVVMPGALTPTEVLDAWNAGADLVKVFPVTALGGADYVKALKSVFTQVELVPTGGITRDTAASYIAAGAAAIGVGGDLSSGAPEKITGNAGAYLAAVRGARK